MPGTTRKCQLTAVKLKFQKYKILINDISIKMDMIMIMSDICHSVQCDAKTLASLRFKSNF